MTSRGSSESRACTTWYPCRTRRRARSTSTGSSTGTSSTAPSITAGPDQNGARVGQEARTGTFSALSDLFLTVGLGGEGVGFVEDLWSPEWASDQEWVSRFQEEWRRLLVRIYIAAVLIEGWPRADREDLQRVVYISTQSAAVAMLSLLGALEIRGLRAEFVE